MHFNKKIGTFAVRAAAAFLLLAGSWLALGQKPPAQAAAASTQPSAQDAVLQPFIDAETLAVAHIDAGKLDTAAIEKYAVALMDDAKLADSDPSRKNLTTARAAADVFLARFKQLGGRHVYVVVAHSDIWPHMQ